MSRQDRELSNWFAAHEIAVPEGRAKKWRLAGLGPLENEDPERAEQHWLMLPALMGRGRSEDHAVLTLAGAGFGCEALRRVLLDCCRLDVVIPVDDGAIGRKLSMGEELAAGWDARAEHPNAPFGRTWRGLHARVRASRSTALNEETGELLWQSFLVDLASAFYSNDEPFEPDVLSTAFAAPDGDLKAGWYTIHAGRELHSIAARMVERAPVTMLATVIAGFRPLMRELAAHFHENPSDDDITLRSACLTPYLLATTIHPVLGRALETFTGVSPERFSETLGISTMT
jgi:hypothetical protein